MKLKHIIHVVIVVQLITLFSCPQGYSQIKALNGTTISASQMDKILKARMLSLNIPGLSVAIINDGKIVYHRTMGMANIERRQPVDKQTLFEAASLTKPVFAYFAMKMMEKGILHPDTPLYKYLPPQDFDYDKRYQAITARMILDHTSGLPNWRSDNPGMEMDIKFNPGTEFSYSGEGYYYLAKVIAHLTNNNLQSIADLLQTEVFTPLGMAQAHVVWNDSLLQHMAYGYDEKRHPRKLWKPKVFNAASSLLTEADSYAHFLIAMMEEKGLTHASFNDMLQNHIALPADHLIRKYFGYTAWGLGFAMKPGPNGMLYCHGGTNENFESGCMFSKEQKAGYIFFINTDKGIPMNNLMEKLLTTGHP
ncbi:serine hydrolase domain-containing protein [Chitinophaga rhizophila]|uniref:Beta-lactamase family protein n=1 Tax=Chitinophaga rhizophila TaxID=2866212 RepID=A0ABS7GHR7_9BACT|nr:serine hydrolase domain-containing protein [Chitinophaga rhizophila]MBW8687228.1 beta-lactamase family protein [Chitinophaga rhizophila]